MAELLHMPEVAAATTTAVLSAWPLSDGTAFGAGEPIAVVETDKAEVEVPADFDGILLRALVPPGAEVEVGHPIALLGRVGEQTTDVDTLLGELGVTPLERRQAHIPERRHVAQEPDAPPTLPPAPDQGGQPPTPGGEARRIFASPLARRMAREAGLDIALLTGSGPGGRIVRDDVAAAIAARAEQPPVTAAPAVPAAPAAPPRPAAAADVPAADDRYEDIPHSRIRKAIAGRLLDSKLTTPHFYLRARLRVGPLLALRERINATGTVKVSVNDLVVKAVARAHTMVPQMNAIWTPEAVRRFRTADVAVAVATDTGLLTPVLRGVDSLSLTQVAARTRAYAEKARSGGLRQDDLEGGSITVTNLGMYGVEEFAAIINPPQSAILAVGAAQDEAVVTDGTLQAAKVMTVVLSVDHRPVDGAVAAQWIDALTRVVEDPLQILL
ncbi:2-oxo acid dehydrogenase subunit E2 [Streptomyces sp. NPDC004376]